MRLHQRPSRQRDAGVAARAPTARRAHPAPRTPRVQDAPRRRMILSVVWVALATVGCGGPKPGPPPSVPVPELTADQCQRFRKQREQLIVTARHDVVQLVAYRWPRQVPHGEGTRTMVAEDALARRLAQVGPADKPGLRAVLIEGRGGSGKSRLAWSIAAQTCDKRAVVRLDASRDLATHLDKARPGRNLVVDILARSAGIKDPDPTDSEVFRALGGRPLLLLLDSIDNVPAPKREAVVAQLNDLLEREALQAGLVALTRPPVFGDYLGLKRVDAHLELPPLTCGRARALCDAKLYTEAERFNFWDFLRRHHLDRQVEIWGRCFMPHLASYRDLLLVRRLATNAAMGREHPDINALHDTRAGVYQTALRLELEKDLEGSTTDPVLAMAIADAMVEAKRPDEGQRDPAFSSAECLQALKKVGKGAGEETCHQVLRSSIFRQQHADDKWHFDNQSIADLFAARWSARQLQGPESADCKAMVRLGPLLQSNETLGFLVGLPQGLACLDEVVSTLCRHGAMSHSVVEQLDIGLPGGKQRAQILEATRKKLTGSGAEPCASPIFDQLSSKAAISQPPGP